MWHHYPAKSWQSHSRNYFSKFEKTNVESKKEGEITLGYGS